MGFFKARPILGGIEPGLERFHGAPTHKTRNEPSAGVAVEHRQFFRHAHRVADGQDIAQNGQAGARRNLAEDRGIQVRGRLHIPVRGVVLIRHDAVEADRIGTGILFMILVIERMGARGIEIAIGKIEPPRGIWGRSSSRTAV